jgi:hypothetical protein
MEDKSGNANHFTTSAVSTWTYDSSLGSGQGGIENVTEHGGFDGQAFNIDFDDMKDGHTVFIVMTPRSFPVASPYAFIGFNLAEIDLLFRYISLRMMIWADGLPYAPTPIINPLGSLNTQQSLMWHAEVGDTPIYRDRTVVSDGAFNYAATDATSKLYMLRDGRMDVDFMELIVCSSTSAAERDGIMNYLENKWY